MQGETFYLAGSWSRRDRCRRIARLIESKTGDACIAQWLNINPDTDPAVGARACIHDIGLVDRVVAIAGDSTSPGKHVEIGYALALGKPVHLVEAPWCTDTQRKDLMDLSVFYYLAESVTSLDEYIRAVNGRYA